MTEGNKIPASLSIKGWGGQPYTLTATFVGLDLDTLGGSWTLDIYNRAHDRVARYEIAATQTDQDVVATITEAQSTALIGQTARFAGFYWLTNSVEPRSYLAGELILTTDPAELGAQSGQGVTVTVSDASVTVAVSSSSAAAVTVPGTHPLISTDTNAQLAVTRLGSYVSGAAELVASARARRDYARFLVSATAIQHAIIGDSVSDRYNASVTGGYTWVEVYTDRLRKRLGLPSVPVLASRKATTLSALVPVFTIGASDPALNAIGFGMDGTELDFNDTVTVQPPAGVTGFTVNWNRQNDATRSYLSVTGSVDGDITGTNVDGYLSTASAFPGVNYATATFTGMTEGQTLTFGCRNHATKTGGITFLNVQWLTTAQGTGDLNVWNGGKFGATTASHLATNLGGHYMNLDLLGTNGVDAGLVIVMLGLNESSSSTFQTNLTSIVTQIRAMQTTNLGASVIFCTPWAKGVGSVAARTEAQNEVWVQAVYDAAAACSPDAWVLPTHQVIPDGYNNYLGLLDTDKIHPVNNGHRALGTYIADAVADFIGAPARPPVLDGGSP